MGLITDVLGVAFPWRRKSGAHPTPGVPRPDGGAARNITVSGGMDSRNGPRA